MGDPSGIGGEIAIKAWHEIKNQDFADFVIFGDYDAMDIHAKSINLDTPFLRLKSPNQKFDYSKSIGIYEPIKLGAPPIFGIPNSANANAIINYIESATNYVINGDFSAICTLPISKAPLYEAGFKHPGHTEFVASLCEKIKYDGTRGPVMMLMIDGLKVALATIHTPISKVSHEISHDLIEKIIIATYESLKRDFAINNPKIAVLGLNPHAGESGTIGKEEQEIINPICEKLRQNGIDCTDALPADSAFSSFNREKYDAYIAMYHDQGLIPIKALDFWGGVNVTLGLPIIRTSPDHGTGYEIAGKNIANPQSFINALKTAHLMSQNRQKYG